MSGEASDARCPRCGAEVPDSSARFCHSCGVVLQPAEAAVEDPLIGRTLLGHYRVERVIAQGGMGRVYLGEQSIGRASRKVAIKILSPKLSRDPNIAARFRREAATILQLTHPSTVRLYEFGEEDGQLFLVMEYVAGDRLAEVLSRGPLPLGRAVAIAVQVAGSLDEAHRHGAIHRDLKPENVILTSSDSGAQLVKVVDFGVAKRVDRDVSNPAITASGALVGTPAYMSPEQFAGLPVDARSDVYALGLLTYQMLSGRLPWLGRNVYEWATRHVKHAPEPLENLVPGLPPRVYTAVSHALAKLPDDRPASAGEFARELLGVPPGTDTWSMVLGGEIARDVSPPPAPSPEARRVSLETLAERLPRASNRTPWAVLLALFFGALAVGFAVVAYVARRDANQRSMASTHTALTNHDAGTASDAAVTAGGNAGATGDAGVRPESHGVHPNHARAEQAIRSGLARAARNDLAGALTALESAQSLVGPTGPELAPLRDRVAALGATAVASRLAAHRCVEAKALLLRLRRTGAEDETYTRFGAGCVAP